MIKSGYNDPTQSKSWKILKTVASHLNRVDNAEVWMKWDRFHVDYETPDTTTW